MVLIRGAGDLASGVALRLHRAGFGVVMTDIARPTALRRMASFSSAIPNGEFAVEGVRAILANDTRAAREIVSEGNIAVVVDPEARVADELAPLALVDVIMAKRNLGTRMSDAPIVICAGPGFTAGADCHAVVETQRGHSLGRVITSGSAAPNNGVPGSVGGHTHERILRAPADGVFVQMLDIGARVEAGDVAGCVGGAPVMCRIGGVLRGILSSGVKVHKGMKSGDVDPRCEPENCFTASDKALAVGGGVLEAILSLGGFLRYQYGAGRVNYNSNQSYEWNLPAKKWLARRTPDNRRDG
ncbi:MAG: EF2563 family selenium-dependent molybdenum hydroxylase system protein [Synergistaceae bacterium]|jgi:xanthine dehydrogenase accessory factor|nr:EF2563 family selenium-dependent molybdenum hydroxylase system protein [Synergistaceae bacterium]